ncbi:MAG: hypothetical protein V7647_1817 [Acidobacteriota bacterium]|jgi:hypothetical protein
MSSDPVGPHADLQFDTAVAGREGPVGAVTCGLCQRIIQSEYYDVSGCSTCADCRGSMQALTETPGGVGPLLKAGAFGLGAGIMGAVIYYAVIAITGLEIGLVAILIGYMVGYAVRKGANGRGGRRFQVLALALTYTAIALAYTPILVKAVLQNRGPSHSAEASERPGPHPMSLPKAVAVLAGLIAAVPIVVIVGGLPSSLISALIMFFGMRQAWKMTAVAMLEISGPYRVGASPAGAPTV